MFPRSQFCTVLAFCEHWLEVVIFKFAINFCIAQSLGDKIPDENDIAAKNKMSNTTNAGLRKSSTSCSLDGDYVWRPEDFIANKLQLLTEIKLRQGISSNIILYKKWRHPPERLKFETNGTATP
jgi:hypothetical protein